MACCALLACTELYHLDDPEHLELGAPCGSGSPDGTRCQPNAPICGSVTGSAYFCTAKCGETPGGSSSMPPPEGALTCERLVTIGTPYCGLSDGGSATAMWFCGNLCGSAGSDDYGPCPPGLTCTKNVCQ